MTALLKNRTRMAGLFIVACAGAFTLGCSAPAKEVSPSDYAFYSNYPELKRVTAPAGVFVYTNPGKPIRDVDQFVVDPSKIAFQPTSPYWIDAAKSSELADYFRQQIIDSLSSKFKVVNTPGAGVLRVSVALADIRMRESADRPAGPHQTHQPVAFLEIRDPASGEVLFLVRDTQRGNEFAAVVKTDEAAARKLLGDWAKALTTRLDEGRRAPVHSAGGE